MAKGPGGFSVGRVSIQVVPDTSEFRKKLSAELKKEVKGIKVEIPVDLDAGKAVAQLKALDSILKKIDGRNINIGANVNSKGDLEKVAKDLSKVGKSASEAASGFSSFSRTGAIVVGVIILLAPALALIATLLAGLPSLLFAFGAAAGAIALGFEGIKKAAEGFAPTVERLKKSLSATFAKELTQPFKDLNAIAPVLDKGLNSIAVSLSTIIKDFVKFVTSGQGLAQINEILQNTSKFFAQISPAINDGLRALFFLGSEASRQFDILGTTLNRFSARFLDMVGTITGDGSLNAALRNLNLVLDTLLDSFVQFFEAGIRAMGVLGGPLTVLLDGFTKAFVALMPILTAISKLVFDVLGEALRQLAPVFEALTPSIQTLGEVLGTILTGALKVIGPLLKVVATILNDVLLKALSAIMPFVPPFLNFLTQLGQIIGEFLVVAFKALAPFLDLLLKFVSDLLIAITPLLPMLLELATTALRTLADILIELAPELVHLGQELFPQLVNIVKQLIPVFSDIVKIIIEILPYLADLASFILDLVIPAMSAMFQTINEVWPGIRQIIQDVLTGIQGFVNVIMGIITGDWDRAWTGVKQILSSAWNFIKDAVKFGAQSLLEVFIALPSRILNAIIGLPNSLFTSGKSMMEAFGRGIVAAAQTVIDKTLAVVNQVRGLFPFSPAKFGPFSGRGYTIFSGRALMEDWAKGIEQGTPKALAAVDAAMSATQNGLDVNAAVAADGFGDLQGQIMGALSGWEVVIDANGITKLVNKTNQKNSRR